jgi:DNA primase
MALINEDYIQELTDHASPLLSEIIGQATTLKKSGKDHVGLCVFHEEKTPSMHVNDHKGCYNCLGCGASGSALKFVTEYYNLPFPDAVARLAQLASFRPVEYISQPSNVTNIRTPIKAALTQASAAYHTHLTTSPKTLNYIASRGITPTDVTAFNIGFAPDAWDFIRTKIQKNHTPKALKDAGLIRSKEGSSHTYDVFRNRLMFPLRLPDGQVIAFGARSLQEGKEEQKKVGKYINTEETPLFNKSLHLYGLYESSKHSSPEAKTLNIVEGYIDVIASHRHGFTNTVSGMGTAITVEQLNKAYRYCDRIRFVFDGDKAGIKAAYSAITTALPLLINSKTALVALMPTNEDPDSLLQQDSGAKSYDILLKKAMPCSQFIIHYLKGLHPGDTPEAKTQLCYEVDKLEELITNPVLKKLLLMELKSALGLEGDLEWVQPNVYKDQLHDDIQSVVNGADDNVKELCGLLLQEPEWLKLIQISPKSALSPDNQDIIDFTLHTLKTVESLQKESQHIHEGSMRFLVLYLQSLAPKTLGLKIDAVKNSHGVLAASEEPTELTNTHSMGHL